MYYLRVRFYELQLKCLINKHFKNLSYFRKAGSAFSPWTTEWGNIWKEDRSSLSKRDSASLLIIWCRRVFKLNQEVQTQGSQKTSVATPRQDDFVWSWRKRDNRLLQVSSKIYLPFMASLLRYHEGKNKFPKHETITANPPVIMPTSLHTIIRPNFLFFSLLTACSLLVFHIRTFVFPRGWLDCFKPF